MRTDKRGCSQCLPGEEQHETFEHAGRDFVQYDYRSEAGELFSCVASTLQRCRQRRDLWLDQPERRPL